ncbi:putative oxidoreductase, zinc-binding dehydrogenase family [Planoprotostelium fungivorum]|uniref:Putative oxidoreductase, zinc-binding dehydrogenase family n=1 Tax=Planoprotostelium fungivorum TaxID=1890364 RepID=A0A2P6MY50_9EUKA|nr:putative oxidoreductase, zinc-binding dehydrogenase family [Planoprotostelium fungivorum]
MAVDGGGFVSDFRCNEFISTENSAILRLAVRPSTHRDDASSSQHKLQTANHKSRTQTMTKNKQLIFKKVPEGYPVPGKDLTVETSEFDLDQKLDNGSIIVHGLFFSLDPYFRGRMRPAEVKSYSPAFTLGQPLTGHQVGEVVKSSDTDKFPVGSIVYGFLPFQQYSVVDKNYAASLRVIKDAKENGIPLSQYVGALGMPGQTAYFGLLRVGTPKKGETLFVSAASGAVGAMVGQLGKQLGLKVVGSVGSQDKLDYITKELNFDAGFNYKEQDTKEQLAKLLPEGIDIYFENVGGETLEAVLDNVNTKARIIACGMISQYNEKEPYGVKNLMKIVAKSVRFEGFLVGNYRDENEEFYEKVTPLVKEGKAPEAFLGLLQGKNFGKLVERTMRSSLLTQHCGRGEHLTNTEHIALSSSHPNTRIDTEGYISDGLTRDDSILPCTGSIGNEAVTAVAPPLEPLI